MIKSRFSRMLALGVCASLLATTAAEAQIFRLFDPATQSFVTYDTGPQVNRAERNRAQRNFAQPSRSRMPAAQFAAQVVDYATEEAPGTIIIDTRNKFLYFVLKNDQALRYGVGVGKEGFGWSGTVKVGRKAEWPTWTPPAEMIQRRPELVEYSGGMPGGPDNPLGARALYLYDGGQDTMFRIHGTNEPWSIGHNVSSGCIRMLNEHVTELHRMAKIGAKVIVM
jgi:lipoprotein-anchoring transpeptidase ErfK/SrfK